MIEIILDIFAVVAVLALSIAFSLVTLSLRKDRKNYCHLIDLLPRTRDGVPKLASRGGWDDSDVCWLYIDGKVRDGLVIDIESGVEDQVEFSLSDIDYEYKAVSECWSSKAVAELHKDEDGWKEPEQ